MAIQLLLHERLLNHPPLRDVFNALSVPYAPETVFFSDLKSGRCSSFVEARLLRFWEARNIKRGGELMWVDILFVDVNSTMMQASISASRLSRFQSKLAAGKM
ncbi:hypothetical protein Rs2_20581 [Raphanus sativus]|nr:hypothetical protein Rs2_20581 [Raphanus sativus]